MKPDILHSSDAISVVKPNGTAVQYHLFDEFEIHLNRIAPHTVQEWHFHCEIEEVILMNSGGMTLYWEEDGEEQSSLLAAGDLVCIHDSVHTFANETEQEAAFTVFRMVLRGENLREQFKADKTLADPPAKRKEEEKSR